MSSQWTALFARLKSWSRFERIDKLDRPFSYWPNDFACVLFGIPRDISFLQLILKRGRRWRASWTRTTVEQLRRSHTQCEHSYWKGNNIIWMKSVALYWGYVNQGTPRILFQLLFFSVFQSVLRITSRKSMYGTIMSGNTQAGSWNELLSRTLAMGWNGMSTVTLIQLVRLQIVLSTTSLQIVLSTRAVNTATKLSFEISVLLTTDSRARTTF